MIKAESVNENMYLVKADDEDKAKALVIRFEKESMDAWKEESDWIKNVEPVKKQIAKEIKIIESRESTHQEVIDGLFESE